MGGAVITESRVLHTAPGRMRLHLPAWSGQGRRALEQQIAQLSGIRASQANALTGNVLILFDAATIDEQTILQHIQKFDLADIQSQPAAPVPPPVVSLKQGTTVRARIAVRGLDREPSLAKQVIEQLEKRSGVRAHANPLTGRVLVEFEEHQVDLEDILSEVADLELPDLPGEDRPAYPLDPGPLMQSATRTLGAALGISVLTTRRLAGLEEALPGARIAAHAAALIGIFHGIPPVRLGLRRLFGRTTADLLFNIPGIITLTVAGSLLGLSVNALESLRLLTEVRARQDAWKRHEERVAHAPLAQPDALIRLENSERAPLTAEVLEGTGTATGRDGMPISLSVGAQLPPGARVYGGPFTVRLKGEESFASFTPAERPAPPAPTLLEHYQRVQGPVSLAYAALTALLTRSFSSTLASLVLVGPRPALIGIENADLSASARVLRAGVTIVGTRPERTIRLPRLLLLDGARLLTDGFEVINALPLSDEMDATESLARASGIASAAGSPWGGIFHVTSSITASNGSFDGKHARAITDGVEYSLGPVENWGKLPEAARLRQRGSYVLALRNEQTGQTLALIALRPRLAPGIQELLAGCKRHGVELAMLAAGDQLAVRALAHRTHITLIEHDDALAAITAQQQNGALVAFASDNAGAAAGFAACDLAIGLTEDRGYFCARADLLAPDLAAVAAIIDAGARRDATARDAVVLSCAANLAGLAWSARGGIPRLERAARITFIAAIGAIADSWLRLHGGARARSTIARLVDPHPERWGRQSVAEVLHALGTDEQGLSSAQALARRRHIPLIRQRHVLGTAILDQLRSPLTGILAAGAGLSLALGSIGDAVIIGATIAANVIISVWQEQKADRIAETLRQIGVSQARVLRDRREVTIAANEIVRGDIMFLAPGDRVAADARVIEAQGLAIDEAALTGESFPASKFAEGGNDAGRIVLEGTDVTTGTGKAVVVAVGDQTRMGALRQALAEEEKQLNPLGVRLSRMLSFFLPISVLGGATVIGSGLLWGKPLTTLLATGATIALAGVETLGTRWYLAHGSVGTKPGRKKDFP